jgi:hypothetical protein
LDASLRNRLTFGPIMLAALLGLLYVDHYVQVKTRAAGMVRETDDRVLWARYRESISDQAKPPALPENPPAINYGVAGVGLLAL